MWDEMARDNLKAAHALVEAGHHRACVSRSYYAALQALTFQLPLDTVPKHEDVSSLIDKHINFIPKWKGNRMVSQLARLRKARIRADYHLRPITTAADAAEMRKIAGSVLKNLEVTDA
jgi:uncharacterized protein (UPF0332 family)